MGNRTPLHQSADGEGGLVRAASVYTLPLLPFEKDLIDLLGISEQEYRFFVQRAYESALTRPAGYEHIPEIKNGPVVPALISLAIGLAASYVSSLLTTKPSLAPRQNSPQQQQEITREDRGGLIGPSRFNSTYGFDSQLDLADYQLPIPIVFGRYTGTTGGMVVSPALVWSRMFSYETQQGVKMLFVVGEQGEDGGQSTLGIDPPDLSGIFIGSSPLNALYENTFTFYWKRNTRSYKRITSANILYGTRGSLSTGDPETATDVFSVPTEVSEQDKGFSSCRPVSNFADFGCYDAIPNATAYRVNWKVVPWIGNPLDPSSIVAERAKISGDNNFNANTNEKVRFLGQTGTGRNYSRRMGIIRLNNTTVSNSTGRAEYQIRVGDTIQFRISGANVRTNFYEFGRVTVDDINNYTQQERIRADDLLAVGELFMIARAVWQVTARSLPQWNENGTVSQIVTLKCLELTAENADRNKIGIVAPLLLDTATYLGDTDNQGEGPVGVSGIVFYPLMRFALGVVRNTRPCEVTEIGIRSRVYQRLNGLANFQAIPAPADLAQAEANSVSISIGNNSLFIKRASAFTIQVRPAGLDASGNERPWRTLGLRFVVVGSQPIDVYNYIRIKHPGRDRYEFRFVPKNGADMRLTPDNAVFWQLSSSGSSQLLVQNTSTAYGVFQVRASGKYVTKLDLQSNKEFATKPAFKPSSTSQLVPTVVGLNNLLPQLQATNQATSVEIRSTTSEPVGFTKGKAQTFNYEIFGPAGTSPTAVNGFKTVSVKETLSDGRSITLAYRARKIKLFDGHYSGRVYGWQLIDILVNDSSADWSINAQFEVTRTASAGNTFKNVPGEGTIEEAGVLLRVTGVKNVDQNLGISQGLHYELFGAATAVAANTEKTVQIVYTTGGKRITLNLTAKAINVTNHWSKQPRIWDPFKVAVELAGGATTAGWAVNETFEHLVSVTSGNPFINTTTATQVGAEFKILSLSNAFIAPPESGGARVFERQSQYADVSHYGDLVEKSNQSGPEHSIAYVNEIVSNETIPDYDRLTICGLSLKAGRSINTINQFKLWLTNGLHVYRFHPQFASARYGPSNHITDLLFYLLTNQQGGLGNTLGMTVQTPRLINTTDLTNTAVFLEANKLYFDGVLSRPVNIRDYISQLTPFFLCNFVLSDGQFGIRPALPVTSSGTISTTPVQIKQLFTSGNIYENSFEVQYLEAEERKEFQAIMRYRRAIKNQLFRERNMAVRFRISSETVPVESFDMTEYCTSREHAFLAAKFLISVRRRVTHLVKFTTSPFGLDLAPGDYIKVVTESSPYSAARNGVIDSTGVITSATALANGSYSITYYKSGSLDVESATLIVSNGRTSQSALFNSVFTVQNAAVSASVYMIEQLTVNEESNVEITASEFPCDEFGASLIARDILNDSNFILEE